MLPRGTGSYGPSHGTIFIILLAVVMTFVSLCCYLLNNHFCFNVYIQFVPQQEGTRDFMKVTD